jgi:hypothetical protein
MLSKRNLLIFTACTFVFGLLFVLYLSTINNFSQFPDKTDFYKFYKSAGFFAEGKSIYSLVPIEPSDNDQDKLSKQAREKMNTLHPNLNAPFHTLFILPLGKLPFRTAFWIWSIFSLCFSLAAVGLISCAQPFSDYERLKRVFVSKPGIACVIYALILWIILLCYFPTWVNIASGQFGLFMLGSIVLIWLSARREKYRLAGIILGIAMSVKIFLGIFLIFFAVQRRWRIFFWALSIFIFCNVISLSTFGLSAYIQHLELLSKSHLYINASWNASFSAFFTRIFGGSENIPLINIPMLAYGLACGLSLLLIMLLIRIAWPQPRDFSPLIRFDIGYAFTIVAMFLISPFGWMYYFPSLIIPLLVIWHISSMLKAGKLYKSMLAVAWIMSCIPTQLINSEETLMNRPIVWFVTSGYYFYALIIFCSLLFFISHQVGRELKGMALNNSFDAAPDERQA